jgi:hypothetical protein
MPFINGRYHVNPIMGQALEAAREAEAALLALQQKASRNSGNSSSNSPGDSPANSGSDDAGDPDDSSNAASPAGQGPIHHVDIEVTEIVPSHSGRAARGFVARLHRAPGNSAPPTDRAAATPAPETHVFADHGDLVNFLHDALATDSSQR